MDMSSILDPKLSGMPCPASVSHLNVLDVPRVIQPRPNTFYGGGLFPWGSRDVFVITPCVYSTTGWVQRRLSHSELFSVLEIPENHLREHTPSQTKSLIADINLIPQKVLLKVLDMMPSSPQSDSILPGEKEIGALDVDTKSP
jgi:hypothetical protein